MENTPTIDIKTLEYLDTIFPEPIVSPNTPYQELTYLMGQRSVIKLIKKIYNEQNIHAPYQGTSPSPSPTPIKEESSVSFDDRMQQMLNDCTIQTS